MGRKAVWCVAVAAMILGLPAVTLAQVPTWQEVQVQDIETMKSKYMALAEAFDEAQYDWRPMDGVRSVREVLGLAIAEANLFPTAWGHDAGPNSAEGFGPELERAGALSKADMLAELEVSFDYLLGVVSGMDREERMAESSFFGSPMATHANIASAMADMHEHLGQLIAYARTNHVVPPWSMGN